MYALIAAIAAAATGFAPPLDRTITFTVSESRDEGTGARRFAVGRAVTFRRRAGGYLAEVDTLRVDGGAAAGAGRLYENALRNLVGRRIRLVLDTEGRVIDVEDRDVEWTREIDAMARGLAGGSPERQVVVDTLLAPLRRLSPAAKVARMAEALDALVAAGAVRTGAYGPRPVTLHGVGPAGAVELVGSERVERAPGGRLRLSRAGSTATVSIRFARTIDAATGLADGQVETHVFRQDGRTLTIVRRMTID